MLNNFRNKRVLVTGATGLIGYRLVQKLLEQENVSVIAISRSQSKLQDCFREYEGNENLTFFSHDITDPFTDNLGFIDYIFHAAGPQENKVIYERPTEVISANISGTLNCISLLRKNSASFGLMGRLILFSSITVYSNHSDHDVTLDESETFITDSLESRSAPYSQSKRASEVIALAFMRQYEVDVVIARLSTVYGDTKFKSDTAFFEFIKRSLARKDISLKSKGIARRDNIYLDDAISGLFYIALRGTPGEAYNVSSQGELNNYLAVDEIAEIIVDVSNRRYEHTGSPISIKHVESDIVKRRPGLLLNNSKLKDLGWNLSTSFEDGIIRTFESADSQ